MNNRGVDVVVIGNILKETIVYPDRAIGPVLGSPCAYSSLVIAKLGLQTGMVSYYGNDYPEGMMNELRLVDKRGIIEHNYSTENHLIYHKDGHKSVEYYKTAPVIQFADLPPEYLGAQVYFVCPMNYEVNIDLCVSLKERGKEIIVDLGGFGGTTVYNRFPIHTPRGHYYISSLCQLAKIVKASEEDLSHLIPDTPVEAASHKLIDMGAEIVLVTLGAKGSLYQIADKKVQYVEAFLPRINEEQYNVVGAGDAFAGGFIYRYIKTQNIQDSVVYGNAVASLMIEKEGACVESRMPNTELADLRRDRVI